MARQSLHDALADEHRMDSSVRLATGLHDARKRAMQLWLRLMVGENAATVRASYARLRV